MFQYAAGRSLALMHGVPHRLDIRGYRDYQLHNGYELDRVFNVSAGVARQEDLRAALGYLRDDRIYKAIRSRKVLAERLKRIYVEPHLSFCPEFFRLPKTCYLDGCWQSRLYFQDYWKTIAEEFEFKKPLDDANQHLAQAITDCKAISVHVRRGDYVTNPVTYSFHGACTIDYYERAIEHILERVNEGHCFVFSDDPQWVKENLKFDTPVTFVYANSGRSSHRDLQLMSLCSNHIIANSSFSWWGAFLSRAPQKIVVAPKRWFSDPTVSHDIVPPEWTTL